MPTSQSPHTTTGGTNNVSDIPSEIQNLLIASQCPPGEDRREVRASRPASNGIIRHVPTPPQDPPTISSTQMPPASNEPSPDNDRLAEPPVLPRGLIQRESQISADDPPTTSGATATRDFSQHSHFDPSTLSQLEAQLEDDARARDSTEDVRLLTAIREYFVPDASSQRNVGSDAQRAHPTPASALIGQPTGLRSANAAAATTEGPTMSGPYRSNFRTTIGSAIGGAIPPPLTGRTGSASGPTSVEEDVLRRAYRTLQETSQLQHQIRDYASADRGATPSGPRTIHRLGSFPSWVDQYSSNAAATSQSASRPITHYDGATLSSMRTGQNPSGRHQRQQSGVITPDRADMIMNLPPLTPLSNDDAKDYGFQNMSSPESGTGLEDETSDQATDRAAAPQYHALKSHRFGRYQPSFLHNGAVFVGTQCSDRQEYNVRVEIKHVDMDESFLCGHLIIEGMCCNHIFRQSIVLTALTGLTQDHPKLETYFEGEIIGSKYTFTTRHPDWGASEKQDMLHWNRFAAWKPLARAARQQDFNYRNFAEREHIFMRWKEYFLVPDHRVTAISGASFEGFYYICFNQRRGTFSGIYYHAKSERRWQQLELKHVAEENKGCMPAVELS